MSESTQRVTSSDGDVWKKTKARVWVLENDTVYALQEKGETIFFLRLRKLGESTRWARPFHREMRLWFMRLAGRLSYLVQRKNRVGLWEVLPSTATCFMNVKVPPRMLATHNRHSFLPQTLQVLS